MEAFIMPNTEHAGDQAARRKTRRGKLLVLAFVISIIVVSVSAILVAWYYAPDNPDRMLTDMGNTHVDQPLPDYAYNTDPPTSGPHVAVLADWGEHAAPIPPWSQLHNLEVGGVIMHYDCPDACPEIVAGLRAILDDMGPDRLILEPYPDMAHPIVVTAWARMLTLDEFDRAAIVDFIESYRGIDHSE